MCADRSKNIGYPGQVKAGDCGSGNMKGLLGRGVVFCFLIWVLITWTCSVCGNSMSSTLI